MRNPKEHAAPKPAARPSPRSSTPTAAAGRAKDTGTLSDSAAPQQAPSPPGAEEQAGSSARIHLLLGPVGAGKSTFARQLAEEKPALRLTLDEWMAELFRPDRPETGVVEWYVERAARCVEQIMAVASAVLALGTDVILEIGLLRRLEREAFYRRVDAAGHAMRVYVLDAPREVRRERVSARNRDRGATFPLIVPPAIFELASDFWEAPEGDELEGRDVRVVTGGAGQARTPGSHH